MQTISLLMDHVLIIQGAQMHLQSLIYLLGQKFVTHLQLATGILQQIILLDQKFMEILLMMLLLGPLNSMI